MSEVKRLVCDGCGSILERESRVFEELEEANRALQMEIVKKNRMIASLRKVTSADAEEYPDAMRVAQYWRDLLAPRARELNGPRLQNTIARLRGGYPVVELEKSIWGYWCRPNVLKGRRVRHDQGGDRRVDLELIMRDATHVDQGLEIADQELRFDQALLNEGASKFVASRCDCGHARGDHGLFRISGHEACHIRDCGCDQFDDQDWLADQWEKERALRFKRLEQRSISEQVRSTPSYDAPVEVPSQGSLL